MPAIGVISTKGGAGKSTTAVNVAVAASAAGFSTAIVDCDNQASAAEWAADRTGDYPLVAQVEEGKVAKLLPARLKEARQSDVDVIVIDTAPRFIADIEAVIKLSDLVIITTQPRLVD